MESLSLSLSLSTTTPTLSPHPSLPLFKPIISPLSISHKPTRSLTPSRSIRSAMAAASVTAELQQQQWGGGEPELDMMGLLLKERIVFLGSYIDDFVADLAISQMLLLDSWDSERDIRLFINSEDGSVSATMAIYDVMNLVKSDVSTIAIGVAGSSSALLLGGGTKGKRLSMPSSRIFIRQPIASVGGPITSVEVQAKEVFYSKKTIVKIISEFSGRSILQVEKDIKRTYYMSPVEGVEYGIIDGIIDKDRIISFKPIPFPVISTRAMELAKQGSGFIVPEIPDDEIY